MFRVVIPVKLELSVSVGFIHKESITMHGHTVLKSNVLNFITFVFALAYIYKEKKTKFMNGSVIHHF